MPIIKDVPSYEAYLLPVVERLRVHGGSMTIQEMVDDVATAMGLTDEQRSIEHGKTGRSEVDYRLAWARTYLKKVGALENSARGVWRLTPKGAAMSAGEIAGIRKQVHQEYAAQRVRQGAPDAVPSMSSAPISSDDPPVDGADDWKSRLLDRLKTLEPAAFERLCQRLLRESDFVKVEVTGRSGDGGIDGTGVLRVALLSFHVLFQCKRYSGSVGASSVRDFRGAMVGRTDKGLIITTGAFTADARREATRDGAPAIDLVDGDALCELLKSKGLGVTVRMVEAVDIDEAMLAAL
jgi:restriction system protein